MDRPEHRCVGRNSRHHQVEVAGFGDADELDGGAGFRAGEIIITRTSGAGISAEEISA
jgi:hypothetical protein